MEQKLQSNSKLWNSTSPENLSELYIQKKILISKIGPKTIEFWSVLRNPKSRIWEIWTRENGE